MSNIVTLTLALYRTILYVIMLGNYVKYCHGNSTVVPNSSLCHYVRELCKVIMSQGSYNIRSQ